MKFWNTDRILERNADYNVIVGERSNGKTTGVLIYCLKEYFKSNKNKQFSIVRRWDTDLKSALGLQMFSNLEHLGFIEKYSNGEFNSFVYKSRTWTLAKRDENGEIVSLDVKPICYGFSIASQQHYKSGAYPGIKNILFDEFISDNYYLPDEFNLFQNLLSTIIRLNDDIKIFMCGNTISKFTPYFKEMGLTNIRNMKKGVIDVYTYGDSDLKVAVEYSDFPAKKKKSDKYFAFNNPKLKMITTGDWQINPYPKLPFKYYPSDVIYNFFVKFEEYTLQAEVIYLYDKDDVTFVYIHNKTSEIKNINDELIYSLDIHSPNKRYRQNILKANDRITNKILYLLNTNQFYYQNNEIGDVFNHYLNQCKRAV